MLDLIIERPEAAKRQAALDAWNGSVGHEGGGRFWRLFDAGLTIRAGVPAEALPFEVASVPKSPPPATGSQAPVNGATGRTDGPKGKDLLGNSARRHCGLQAVCRAWQVSDEPYDNQAVWWADGGAPCSACLRPSAIGCACERGTTSEATKPITTWEQWEERDYQQDIIDRERDRAARAADREAFYARHEARHAAKAEPIEVEPGHPDPESDGSYSLGDPQAAKVLHQLRLDAEAARRAHAPGADLDADD